VWNSIVHLAWEEKRDDNREIYYKRSTDNGVTWEGDQRLTEDDNRSWNPSIAVWDSIVHVVWFDDRDGNWEIYYKRSTDNGVTWEGDQRLTEESNHSRYPSIAVWDSIVHVVWYDIRDGNWEIYYKRSTDNGVTWEGDQRLTEESMSSYYPAIAVWDSIVHVVWYDIRDGNREIYYKRSLDNGVTWEGDRRLTEDSNSSRHPSIAVCDSVVHVTWFDARDGNREIYYKRSPDNGVTWGKDERLTNAPKFSWFPSIACWDCTYDYDVHIMWTDERDNNLEIYYKRHKCGPTRVEEDEARSSEIKVKPVFGLGKVWFSIYLPQEVLVEIWIFDVSGREVERSEFMGFKGKNEFSWKSRRSGLYFFKFKIGNYEIQEKVIIF
jgi:Neuraminidase (sialidase)